MSVLVEVTTLVSGVAVGVAVARFVLDGLLTLAFGRRS